MNQPLSCTVLLVLLVWTAYLNMFDVHDGYIWEKHFISIGLLSRLPEGLFQRFTFNTVTNVMAPHQNWSDLAAL